MLKNKVTIDSEGKINPLMIGAIAAALLILLGLLKAFTHSDEPPEAVARPVVSMTTGSEQQSTIMKAREKVNAERQQRAREAIAEHEEAIALNFSDEHTPDRLMAVGNLHQYDLGDYYSAIQSYQMLIDTSPNHPKVPQAYAEIAACYERLGEEVEAQYIYEEMVAKLDPSLQHTQFAKVKLGRDY